MCPPKPSSCLCSGVKFLKKCFLVAVRMKNIDYVLKNMVQTQVFPSSHELLSKCVVNDSRTWALRNGMSYTVSVKAVLQKSYFAVHKANLSQCSEEEMSHKSWSQSVGVGPLKTRPTLAMTDSHARCSPHTHTTSPLSHFSLSHSLNEAQWISTLFFGPSAWFWWLGPI